MLYNLILDNLQILLSKTSVVISQAPIKWSLLCRVSSGSQLKLVRDCSRDLVKTRSDMLSKIERKQLMAVL